MTQVLLALLLIPSATRAPNLTDDLALCARIGAQSQAVGQITFRRDVRFQLCTMDGRPLMGLVNLELHVDGPGVLAVRNVSTDAAGRFSIAYGGGASQSRELHTFLLDGEVIAAFLVERGPAGLEFTRSKNLQDDIGGPDYP
jgi:hypothetical protein